MRITKGKLLTYAIAVNNLLLIAIIFQYFYPESVRDKYSLEYFSLALFVQFILLFLKHRYYSNIGTREEPKIKEFIEGGNREDLLPIALYLRPFAADHKFNRQIPLLRSIVESLSTRLAFLKVIKINQFESDLFEVLESRYLSIRFDSEEGSRFKSYLGARFIRYIDKSAEWLENVKDAAAKACMCLMMPPVEIKSATSLEVTALIDHGMREKLVFIMPPFQNSFKTYLGERVTAKQAWNNLRNLADRALHLPRFHNNGGFVLLLGDKFRLIQGVGGVSWYDPRAIRKIFLDGRLCDTPLFDSFKFTFRVTVASFLRIIFTAVFIPATLAFLVSVASVMGVASSIENWSIDFFLNVFVIVLALAALNELIEIENYCRAFMLSGVSSYLLFWMTFPTLLLFVFLYVEWNLFQNVESYFSEFFPYAARYMMEEEPAVFFVRLLSHLFLIGLLWSVWVFLSSLVIFSRRETLVYRTGCR